MIRPLISDPGLASRSPPNHPGRLVETEADVLIHFREQDAYCLPSCSCMSTYPGSMTSSNCYSISR